MVSGMDGSGPSSGKPAGAGDRFVDALRAPSFAAVFGAETQSVIGDQLARVAIAVLVFRETASAAATALSLAATFLPAIVGGALLGRLGDRYARRPVMMSVDLVRAVLFAVMALPGVPTLVRLLLLVAAVFVTPLFGSAAVSYLATTLTPEQFRAATGLRLLNSQAAQVVGFAAGGALVGALGPRAVLALDAGTFVLSIAIIGLGAPREIGRLPRAGRTGVDGPGAGPGAGAARTHLWDDTRVRALMGLSALAGFFIAPEGLAVPFAGRWDTSATRAGVLLAAIPLGSVLGVYVVVRRIRPERRVPAAATMAVLCGLPLVLSAPLQSFPLVVTCWVVSGAFAAYQVEVISRVVQAIPDAVRARTVGVVNAVLIGAQGLGVALFGVVADALSPARALAVAGALGTLAAIPVARAVLRTTRRVVTADAVVSDLR